MRAGALDARVRLETYTTTRDPHYNTEVKTWAAFATVWAQVQDVLPSKAETVQASVGVAERPCRLRIRWLPGVRPDMRVVILGETPDADRICEIVAGPAELGRREGIELLIKDYGRQPP
jgi:SPP1 family predicted phage head-tail adaptor